MVFRLLLTPPGPPDHEGDKAADVGEAEAAAAAAGGWPSRLVVVPAVYDEWDHSKTDPSNASLPDWAMPSAENGDTYVNYAGLALAALGVLYAVLGLLGTLCFEGKQNPVRCATGWLATTNAFGVLMLIIIALLLAGELTAGIVLGDKTIERLV